MQNFRLLASFQGAFEPRCHRACSQRDCKRTYDTAASQEERDEGGGSQDLLGAKGIRSLYGVTQQPEFGNTNYMKGVKTQNELWRQCPPFILPCQANIWQYLCESVQAACLVLQGCWRGFALPDRYATAAKSCAATEQSRPCNSIAAAARQDLPASSASLWPC